MSRTIRSTSNGLRPMRTGARRSRINGTIVACDSVQPWKPSSGCVSPRPASLPARRRTITLSWGSSTPVASLSGIRFGSRTGITSTLSIVIASPALSAVPAAVSPSYGLRRRRGGAAPLAGAGEAKGHHDPEEVDHLRVAEVVLEEPRHEEGGHRRDAARHQGPVVGPRGRERGVDAPRAGKEGDPDPEPGPEAEQTVLGANLDEVVVQMASVRLPRGRVLVGGIGAVDAAGPEPEERRVLDDAPAGVPEVQALAHGRVLRIAEREQPRPERGGHGKHQEDAEGDRRHEPEPAPPDDEDAGRDREAEPGAPHIGEPEGHDGGRPRDEQAPRVHPPAEHQQGQAERERDHQAPAERHVDAEKALGPEGVQAARLELDPERHADPPRQRERGLAGERLDNRVERDRAHRGEEPAETAPDRVAALEAVRRDEEEREPDQVLRFEE